MLWIWGTLLSIFLFSDTSIDKRPKNGGRKAEQAPPLVFVLCKNTSPLLQPQFTVAWLVRQACVSVWSRRKLDLMSPTLPCLQSQCLRAGTGASCWQHILHQEQPGGRGVTLHPLHLEWEAAWHWPCNLRACLLHATVPAILLISCFVFPALSRILPYLSLFCPEWPMTNCIMQKFQPLFLLDKDRIIFKRITV